MGNDEFEKASKVARVKWATDMVDHMGFESEDHRRKQIPLLGVFPWDAGVDWAKSYFEKQLAEKDALISELDGMLQDKPSKKSNNTRIRNEET